MSLMTPGMSPFKGAIGLMAVAVAMVVGLLAGCGGSNTAAPAPATVSTACLSNTIGPAGCTLTGPDGVQVVVPAGALSQPTIIGIVRNPPAGAPAPLQEGNAPAGPVYEFTPHDLVFNVPVTIRMPVTANGVGAEVFMASLGADWQVNNATLVNGFAEWQRNSFSFGMAGLACAIPAGSTDLYPCAYPSGGAAVEATAGAAITQIAPGWLNFGSGSAGSWRVTSPGTIRVTLHYRAAPDCSGTGGSAPSGHVKLIRWNPAVSPHVVTTIRDVTVGLNVVPVTPPAGTFAYTGNGGASSRGEGSTTVDVSSNLTDATNAFGFTFSCQRPGHPVHTGGDLITIIGPMAAPVGPFTIGGPVSGLTGSGMVLQNNASDNLTVPANATSFQFAAPIAAGNPYSVTVLTQPSGQTCNVVQNGSGVNVQANVPNVAVSCGSIGPVPLAATSIAAGFWNSMAVATDGTVWAWGDHVDPTTGGYSASTFAPVPVQVQGLTGVRTVALSSESGAFYALHTDGTVSAWGRNDVGQLGDRTTTTRLIPVKVLQDATTPMDEVCRIAAGSNVLLMARETGCSPGQRSINYGPWVVGLFIGQNFGGESAAGFSGNGAIAKLATGWPVGQTGSQTASVMTVPDAANAGGAIAIRTGRGDLYIWGANGGNRLGAGSSVSFAGGSTGLVLGGWSGLYPVEMGRDFAIAVDETGTLESVGRNLEGQLGDGTTNGRTTMAPVLGLPASPVTAYSVGQVSAAAITNGQLWAWGWNALSNSAITLPTRLGTGTGFTQVSVGDVHSLTIGPNGEVYSWGDSSFGALGRSGSGTLPAVVMRP